MSKIDDSVRYYRKMSDLQEKLRRSEEERLQLEEKFTLLMRACRDEEEIRLNLLRDKYEKFLEEEKIRKERNERILLTLERIESRAHMLTAKSDRLRLLRRHYEAYLMRMYPKWKYITDKSKAITDQDILTNPSYGLDGKISPFHPTVERELHEGTPLPHYNHYSNLTVPTNYKFPPSDERIISSAPPTRPFSTSVSPLSTLIGSKAARASESAPPRQIPMLAMQEAVKPERSSAERSIILTGNPQLLSGVGRTSDLLNVKADHRHTLNRYLNDAGVANVKEQQLRDYPISEQEQNTSGDLLNVSLSDDGILQDEVEYPKSENMVSQPKNKRQLAGGDVLQVTSKTSQQIAATPPSNQIGAGDFEQHKINQKSEPEKNPYQMPGKIQIKKQHSQANIQKVQQHAGEQHLKPVLQQPTPQAQIPKQQMQSKVTNDQLNQHATEGQQIQPMTEQNAETVPDLQQSREYPYEDQKQFNQQHAEQSVNDQYDQLAAMQEGQPGQVYEQEFLDQRYTEEGQLDQQYDDQYQNQYNLQYSEQDQMNQQYYEQYPEQAEMTQQYDQQYVQQYAEEGQIDQQYDQQYVEQSQIDQQYVQQYAEEGQVDQQYDQQYAEQSQMDQQYVKQYAEEGQVDQQYDQQYADQSLADQQYAQQYTEEGQIDQQYDQQFVEQSQTDQHYAEDQQYLEQTPADELNQQQYNDQGQIIQNYTAQGNGQYTTQYDETQQAYSEQADGVYAYSEQQQEGVGDENQQHSATASSEEVQEKQLGAQQETSKQNEYNENVQQLQQHPAPQQQQPEEQQNQKQVDSQQEHVIEVKSSLEPESKLSDEHQGVTGDKEPEVDVEEYRRLLGETGEVETSETDELEAQLAELVEPKAEGAKETKKTNQQPKDATEKPISRVAKPVTEAGNVDDSSSSDTGGNLPVIATKVKEETLSVPQSKEDTVTAVSKARPTSKRLPVLNKVLESDSESLQLDATVSNAESDDFDFSSEQ